MDLSFDYVLTVDDFVDFQVSFYEESELGRKGVRKTRLLLALMYALSLIAFLLYVEGVTGIVTASALAVFAVCHIAMVRKSALRRIAQTSRKLIAMAGDNGPIGAKRLEIRDGELSYVEGASSMTMRLADFARVGESDTNYFLYKDNITAIILPKSCRGDLSGPKAVAALVRAATTARA